MTTRAPDDPTFRAFVLQRRLATFAQASLIAVLPSLASILVLLAMYAGHANGSLLLAWGAIAATIIGARILIGLRARIETDDLALLERQWRRVNAALVLGSLAWAVSLPLAAWIADSYGHSTFAIIGAVLFSGVLLLHRTAPAAAVFHILVLGAGIASAEWIASGPAAWPLMVLIALFAATLMAAVRAQERAFRAACEAEIQRRESDRAVAMLLSDHEAQAAPWRWTLDPDGAIRDLPEDIAEMLGLRPEELEGRPFVSLIAAGPERDTLAARIAGRLPFRNAPAPVDLGGTRHVWSLSGQPRPDGTMSVIGRDATDQQRIAERVRAMAYRDPLTGLANRHLFNERLHEVLGDNGGEPRPAALFYLDLDAFKAINDQHGHLFGDSLLRELAARLRRELGDKDVIARLGGDEFAVLIEAPPGDGILLDRAHRVLAAAREPFEIDRQTLRISTSIGIARADRGCDAAELMRRGDLALYAAKAKGRDQLALYDRALDRRARERRTLELELAGALAREEMVLHYQPIIALGTGATVGYEALLRWRHPRRGLLMPDAFLALAEESGQIVGLGDWVIRRALAEVAFWEADFRLSINLSPTQIRNPLLITTIDSALAATGFDPRRLEFEITEHVLLQDAGGGMAMLERLRALGAEIALDDFGTGYSSLSYLRRFRFDRIKIDRSFVADIETSHEAQAIVSAITRLAQALGVKTTAEGIERAEQLDLLRKLGCDEGQGFLILAPTDAARIESAHGRGQDLPGAAAEIASYRQARRAASARLRKPRA
jgi:diguanylate cyclase (GGDEF)-like protein